MKLRRTTIWIPIDTYKELKKTKERTGIPISQQLIRSYEWVYKIDLKRIKKTIK